MNLTDLERQIQLQDLYRQAALERSLPRVSLRSSLAQVLHALACKLESQEKPSSRPAHA